MLAGPDRVIEPIQRRQIPQSMRHNRRLARNTRVVLTIADEHRTRDLPDDRIVHRVGAELGEPVEGRGGVEGEEALVDEPAEAGRRGGVDAFLVQFGVEGRGVAAVEQRVQRRGDIGCEGRLHAVHTVDGEGGDEAVFGGGGAEGQRGAEGDAHEAEAAHVDVRPRAEVVDHWCDNILPLRDEAEALVAPHRRLPGAFVRDDIPAAREDAEADLVQGVFLGGIVAATHEDRRLGYVVVRAGRAVEDCRDLEPVCLYIDAFAGHWQQRDGFVEGRGLRVPERVDARIGYVAVQEKIGGAEICCYAEVGFTSGYGKALRVNVVGDSFYTSGHAVERAVEAFEVSVLDRGGGCQDFADACSMVFRHGHEDQKLKREFSVVTERVHWRGGNRAGGCCGRRGRRRRGGRQCSGGR